MMGWINSLTAGCIISCLLVPGIFQGDANGYDAAEGAVVKTDSLPVYPRPAVTDNVVRDLKKGEQVITDVELIGSDGVAWCNVLREWDMTIVGYVKCEGLKKTEPARPERWQTLPTLIKPSRPVEQKPAEPKPAAPVPKALEQPTSPKPPAQEPQPPEQPPVVQPSYPETGRSMGL